MRVLPQQGRFKPSRGMSSVRYGTRLGDLKNKPSTHGGLAESIVAKSSRIIIVVKIAESFYLSRRVCSKNRRMPSNSFVILLQMFDWSKVSTLTSQITLINRHKVFGMGGTMGRNVNA